MRKIWLYVDDRGQLNLSFYKNETDDKPFKKFIGRQSYPYIEKIFNGKMKNRKRINNIGDHTFEYDNYYIDVFDLESVLEKYGTKPILEDITAYESLQTAKKIKKLKVQRRNKRIKVKATAAGLVLVLLGGVAAGTIGNKKSNSSTSTVTIEQEIDDLLENEEEVKEVEEITLENEETNEKIVVKLDYLDQSDQKKAFKAKSYYGDTITKYANQYGVDPAIMIAIATQERGIHSEDKDKGGATGLMQIQNNVWKNQKLSAFNYNTNSLETIIVDEDSLSDVYYNIKVGCMIFQNNMKEMNNNIIAAIQCYNMGAKNMGYVLQAYSNQTGKSIKEILLDIDDYGWLDYRNVVKKGDNKYVENVVRWLGENAQLGTYSDNGEQIVLVATPKSK